MHIILFPLLVIATTLLGVYKWIIIGHVILNWLVSFNVINYKNNFVVMVREFLALTTEPAVTIIRKFLPTMGGIDFSPLVLILFVWFLQMIIGELMVTVMVGSV